MPLQSLHYPDLTPPPGWTGVNMPPQIRLIPPGTTLETARATIIVSPVGPRHAAMPPPAELITQAVEAEAKVRLDVLARTAPENVPSDHGLDGIAVRAEVRDRVTGSVERRIYVIYADAQFLYGVSYMAFGAAYDEHQDAFWQVARSIRPFKGQAVAPAAPAGPVVD